MKKLLLFSLLLFTINSSADAAIFQGNVSKVDEIGKHRIVDADTNVPIDGATVTVPQKNYETQTDSNGTFNLDTNIRGNTILSVQKEGYKPFSLTVNEQIATRPMTVGIEKSSPMDLAVETSMFHLGDNNYSELSANAGQFRVKPIGPFYTKKFVINKASDKTFLVIGSIIGIDTKMAQMMGQNKISVAYACPPEVFFNGVKIAEIQLNGDGQKMRIPKNLIRLNQQNEITIKTGRNMLQTDYIDYDDIEFMNLSIEVN
ncbi:MAG: carboxypeptidase-like regulatory domain-containing protein [Candidatus Gastranaerophilaceae bacterium]